MANFIKFHQFIADRNNGVHDLQNDVLKFALTNVQPDAAADAVFADIVEIAPGGGYDAGGKQVLIQSSAQVGGVYSLVPAADVIWTATGAFSDFQFVVLYNDTAAGKNLIAYYDNGAPVTMQTGGRFIADVGATLFTDS